MALNSHDGLGWHAQALFFVGMALWLTIFIGGITVDTCPHREAISPGGAALLSGSADGCPGAPETPGDLERYIIVGLFFTPANLALLCILAGLLGAVGNHAKLHADRSQRGGPHPPPLDSSNPYISGMLRGFFVYLAGIAGLLILSENPFQDVTPHQYIRVAGFMSGVSFLFSYRPRVFEEFMRWISNRLPAGLNPEEAPSSTPDIEVTVDTDVDVSASS